MTIPLKIIGKDLMNSIVCLLLFRSHFRDEAVTVFPFNHVQVDVTDLIVVLHPYLIVVVDAVATVELPILIKLFVAHEAPPTG
jgi:hypothetical protein